MAGPDVVGQPSSTICGVVRATSAGVATGSSSMA